jgi:hypothetical protein
VAESVPVGRKMRVFVGRRGQGGGGAGVVGGEKCVDAEVGAGGEDMQGRAGDQRIEVYGVGVEQSRPGECFGRVPSRSCTCVRTPAARPAHYVAMSMRCS